MDDVPAPILKKHTTMNTLRSLADSAGSAGSGRRARTAALASLLAPLLASLLTSLLTACASGRPADAPALPPVAAETISTTGPCCGPVTADAQHILDILNASNVEHLWQKSTHVAWDTGEPDMSPSDEAAFARIYRTDTHCSAYGAAIAQRLGIYMLRPPEHRQTFLASAQTAWFGSHAGAKAGWYEVTTPQQAQALANGGKLVVVSFASPDPTRRPGHLAIVRPDAARTLAQIQDSGLILTQAGNHNHNRISEKAAFRGHPGAWPQGVKYFAHDLPRDTAAVPK